MSSDKTPDDATGDSVILARVHAFMLSLLTFLGFNALPNETVTTMLDTLFDWLDEAKKIRRDPQGATAKIWWDAFKLVWSKLSPDIAHNMADAAAAEEKAAQSADRAVAEFGKRFLPVVDEHERDTLNTADFDAMRAELDQADRFRGEVCDAIDGVPCEFRFAHPRLICELRAERDALLASNKHHTIEIESLRNGRNEQRAALCKALGWPNDAGFDVVAAIVNMRKERDDLRIETANAANALDGVRAAIGQKNLPDADVPACVKSEIGMLRERIAELEDHYSTMMGLANQYKAERDSGESVWYKQRDHIKDLEKQLGSAIVPQPKPEHIKPGQRWALLCEVTSDRHDDGYVPFDNDMLWGIKEVRDDKFVYLGTDKV